VVKAEETVINSVPGKLGSNITDLDSREWLVVLKRSNLNDERLDTVVLSLGEQAGHQDAVSRRLSQTTRPPLGGSDTGSIDDKLLSCLVVSRGGLDATEERSVTKSKNQPQ
jgi:hypothetical protein